VAGRFTVEAIFKAADRITEPVRRMQKGVGKFTRSAERGFRRLDRAVGKFGDGIKRGAATAAVALGVTAAAMGNVISVGADFGRAIGSAAAKFPEQIERGTQAFDDLAIAARGVGAATEFTATQSAQGLKFLAKAGFTAKASIASLPSIVDFATASEIELAEAADIASDALGAFGLDSTDTGKKLKGLRRVMDVMSSTANATNTSVSELFEAVKDGAPISAAAGVSIETFSAAMGFLASNGIKASKAGTAAKNITLALAGVGNKAAETFKRLGISLADSNGNLRDQFDVMDDLRKKLAGVGEKRRVNLIAAIFGKIPIAAATKLLADSSGKVRELRKAFEAAGGSSKRIAAFIRNDVKGSLDGLGSAIEGVKISIFEINKGPLKEAIDKMTMWVRTNDKLIASKIGGFFLSIINNFENIVKWVKRIGVGLGIFLALTVVLKTLVLVMTAVNLVMALNPIGLIVLGVVALIAAVTALVVWWDELKAVFVSLPGPVKTAFAVLMGPIGALIAAASFVMDAWEPIKLFFTDLFESIAKVANVVSAIPGGAFNVLSDTLFGGNQEGEGQGVKPKVVSPQERVARSIEERQTTNTSQVTIRDETGRAEVTNGNLGRGVTLQEAGAF